MRDLLVTVPWTRTAISRQIPSILIRSELEAFNGSPDIRTRIFHGLIAGIHTFLSFPPDEYLQLDAKNIRFLVWNDCRGD